MIDISNPQLPVLKSALPTGFIHTGVPGIFGLPEPQEDGIGHTASCIQDCNFAYLAGTAEGIQIVDLRDPAAPKLAKRFKPPITGIATHDVQVDGDRARVDRRWRRERRVRREGSAQPEDGHAHRREHRELGPARLPGARPGLRHRRQGGDADRPDPPRQPSLPQEESKGDFEPKPGKTYPAGGNGKVVGIVEEDYNRPTCEGAGSFQTWGITDKRTSTGAQQARAARPVRDRAREPRAGPRLGSGHGPLLGALLRRARWPRRGRLVRGGHALPRRERPGRHPPGRLLGADQGRDLVGALRADRSDGSIVYALDFAAASTCCASTARTSGPAPPPCGARGSGRRQARAPQAPTRRVPRRGRRPHRPHAAAASSASSAACRAGSPGKRSCRRSRASTCCRLSLTFSLL